jgi:hypothetical protein
MTKKSTAVSVFALMFLGFAVSAAAVTWDFKGFFNTNYEYDTRPNIYGSFDPFIFAVISNVNFDENTMIRLQVNYEHGPYIELETGPTGAKVLESRASGEISATSAYVQYTAAEYLKICAGKFFAPIGFYNQLRYSPTYAELKSPEESVYKKDEGISEDVLFFQRQAAGLWVRGDVPLLGQYFSYDLYYVNGRTFEIQTDVNDNKSLGGRFKVEISTAGMTISPVVSFYTDDFNAGALDAPDNKSQFSVIPGLELNAGDFDIKSELALSRINKGGAMDRELASFYAEVQYTIAEKITPFARFEFLEPDTKTANDRQVETTVGALYHIKLWTSLVKAQVRFHQTENNAEPSYIVYGAGVALGF